MANPVERWLETFMCKQYADTFEAYGYKTLQSLCQLQLSQLHSMGVSPEHCDKILENVSVLRQTMSAKNLLMDQRYTTIDPMLNPASNALANVARNANSQRGMMPYGDNSNGPGNYMQNPGSEPQQMSAMNYQQGMPPGMSGMGPPMPPQGYGQGQMHDGYHGNPGQMYPGMPQQQPYNPYMNQGDYQQMPPPSPNSYSNQGGFNPYYRGPPNNSSPGYPGGNVPPGMLHPRNPPPQPQTPQQVADNILQMASSGVGQKAMSPGMGPNNQFRTPSPMMSPQMGNNQMVSPTMRQPGAYMYPNQNQMSNRNSPISPMQARSPASVHSGHSIHSPGPQQSPSASQPSPGVHGMKSPSVQPVHHSPASTPAPSMASPGQSVPPGASPIQSGGSSTGSGSRSSPGNFPTATNQSNTGHFSTNDLPQNHSSPTYSMCSASRNQPVSSTFVDSQPTSAPNYVTTPSGLSSLSNPLQSLQKLVMLPESQVVDPKSVVNDGSLSGDGGSKNDESGELASPVSSPKMCFDGQHCGSDSENLQAEFERPRPEPQVVNIPSYSGGHKNTARCLENQFPQSNNANCYQMPTYQDTGMNSMHNMNQYGHYPDPSCYQSQQPSYGNYPPHINPPPFPNQNYYPPNEYQQEANISLPPKKKRKRTKKSECESKGKNKKNSPDNNNGSHDNESSDKEKTTIDKPQSSENQNSMPNSLNTNNMNNKHSLKAETSTTGNRESDCLNKLQNSNDNEYEKQKQITNKKGKESEYDFEDENEHFSSTEKENSEEPKLNNIASGKNGINKSCYVSPNSKIGSLQNNKIRKKATYSRENYLGTLAERSLVNDFDVVLDNCVTSNSLRSFRSDEDGSGTGSGTLLTRINADIIPGSCINQLKCRKAAVHALANGTTAPVIRSPRSESKIKAQIKPKRKSRVINNSVKLFDSDGEIYSSDPEDYVFPLAEKSAQIVNSETSNKTKKRGRLNNLSKLNKSPDNSDQENKLTCAKSKQQKNTKEATPEINISKVTSFKCKPSKVTIGTNEGSKSPRSGPEKGENQDSRKSEKDSNSENKTKGTNSTPNAEGATNTEEKSQAKDLSEETVTQKQNPSKSPVTLPSSTEVTPEGSKKKRGRPFGSKNKTKCTRRKKKDVEEDTEIDLYSGNGETIKNQRLKKTLDMVVEKSKKGKKKKQGASKTDKEKTTGPYIKAVPSSNSLLAFKVINTPEVDNEQLKVKRKSGVSEFSEKPASLPPVSSLDDSIPFLCALCGKPSNYQMLGDLFGPYFSESSSGYPSLASPNQENKGNDWDKKKIRRKSEETKVNSGRKRTFSGRSSQDSDGGCVPSEIWVHEDCAVWSHGVYLHGRKVHGLEDAISVAKQSTCTACKCLGAHVGCFYKGCNVKYHYLCATERECLFDEENFSLLCPKHKEKKLKNKNS